MTKRRFIGAGASRPAWTEGGPIEMLRGSDTPGQPEARPGFAPLSTLRAGFDVQSIRLAWSGLRSTLHSSFVGVSYRRRLLLVGLQKGLARVVAEGARHAGRHRAGQLEGIRRPRPEEPERCGHAPEETITLRESGRHARIDRRHASEAGERRRGGAGTRLGAIVTVHELEGLDEE